MFNLMSNLTTEIFESVYKFINKSDTYYNHTEYKDQVDYKDELCLPPIVQLFIMTAGVLYIVLSTKEGNQIRLLKEEKKEQETLFEDKFQQLQTNHILTTADNLKSLSLYENFYSDIKKMTEDWNNNIFDSEGAMLKRIIDFSKENTDLLEVIRERSPLKELEISSLESKLDKKSTPQSPISEDFISAPRLQDTDTLPLSSNLVKKFAISPVMKTETVINM